MQVFWAFLTTNFKMELRLRETISALAGLSLLLSVVLAFGVESCFLELEMRKRMFAVLQWVILVLSAAVCIGRSFDYDLERKAMEGIVLSGRSLGLFFLAKTVSNFSLLTAAFLGGGVVLAVLMNITVWEVLWPLLGVAAAALLAYSALATLIGAIASMSKIQHILLPLLLLPLALPIFFGAVELSISIIEEQRSTVFGVWLGLLLMLDVLYVVLGASLFRFVVKG